MAELAPRCGPLLGPRWANWAEILHGKQARVWLRIIQISLGRVELRGGGSQKTKKNGQKLAIFAGFGPGSPTVRPIARPPVGRSGQNFLW